MITKNTGKNKIEIPISKFLYSVILLVAYESVLINSYIIYFNEVIPKLADIDSWIMSFQFLVLLTGFTLFFAWILSNAKWRPSDFFILFYGGITIFSFITLNPISGVSGEIDNKIFLSEFIILSLPLINLIFTRKIMSKIKLLKYIKISQSISPNLINLIITALVILCILISFFHQPESIGFDFESSFKRRIEGREIYIAGSPFAYLMQMTTNGFLPYLAFKTGLHKKIINFIFIFFAALFFYWLVGLKAPILYVLATFVIGILIRNNKIKYMTVYFLSSVIFVWFVGLIEKAVTNQSLFINDFFFRRIFFDQAEVQGYYFDFLWNDIINNWDFLQGIRDPSINITYYIGEYYYNNQLSNVNTSAFLHAFVEKGATGLLISCLAVTSALVLLDTLWDKTKNPSYLFLGFLLGALLIEQSYTVIFISSGFLALLLITIFENSRIPFNPISSNHP
jgi:hypothetical protein